MKYKANLKTIICIMMMMAITCSAAFAQTNPESNYKIKQVYVPEERKPTVEYRMEQLPFKNAGGQLPSREGENFQININGQYVKSQDDAKKVISNFLESLKSPLRMEKEIRLSIDATTAKSDAGYIDEQIRIGKETTKEKIKREMLDVSTSSDNMLNELGNELKQQSSVTVSIFRFDQYFDDVIIDNTAISITNRNQSEIVSLHGKFYNSVKPTNNKSLSLKEAASKAMTQIRAENKLENLKASNRGEIVLLPYAEGFKYTWKTEVSADGPYQVWIDAETGKVLQLLPLFFYADNAKGLTFNPDPNSPTRELTFEVDAAVGGNYTLVKTGVLTLFNNGADGTVGIVTVPDTGSGTADFNVAPINGTVVERTNQAGYNGQFQQVNAFATIFNERKMYMLLGSEVFLALNVTVNDNNPCGFGINNACSSMAFGIGGATTSNSTSCGQLFNSALDGTIVAHEFGHRLNGLQYGVGGGVITGSINEGLADFWGCTNFNTDIVGGWWAHNCPAPVQSGFVPRQAEATDIFPDRNSGGGSNEIHSAGQNIAWAQWSSRQGMNDATSFGTLSINLNTIKAMTTAGVGVLNDGSSKSIHDSNQNLLKQLAPLYQSSRMIHKLLAGYARAGIFLSPKDAIIDIDHSYLNRASATGPVFTVWTGDDYTFAGNNVVTSGVLPFNTQFQIEIANDEAFAVNHITSAWLGGVASAAGGTASYTLPVADWNTLKAGTDLYYKVTTRDAAGGNSRSSLQPGNNFLAVNVPVGRAAINGTGTKDCSCSASASPSSSKMALIPLLPLIGLIVFRRRKTKKA
ncbi:MAG: PepSY domain-containing protein [Bacteroidota bacterium]|nr:PepSY domain-containing protein [Bacteroidota bacterium]